MMDELSSQPRRDTSHDLVEQWQMRDLEKTVEILTDEVERLRSMIRGLGLDPNAGVRS